MSWIEVIHVRSIQSKHALIADHVHRLISEIREQNSMMKINAFSRCNLKTDHCLHLHHQSEQVMKSGSKIGNHLADELKKYGLVNHSIWRKYER